MKKNAYMRLTTRDNILFGLPMNMERYKAVVFVSLPQLLTGLVVADEDHQATGLLPDLQLLEDADLTEIGERCV